MKNKLGGKTPLTKRYKRRTDKFKPRNP